ncbi:aminoglycoside phosphotransferase family protein [uncultured Planococcus sp.]|uniref:aminoglycoside phosphotransferase family protein n=1 Tax=uncultured Planococcus sp. TaxID=337815 RepID=UPI00261DAE3D|nr:aminoglycoside phosphotransferase family protein [uncultured Planococcus sp.]
MLNDVLEQFGIQTAAIYEVEDSFSSTVYKCELLNGKNVYVKIPYTKLKYQRELEAYKILEGKVLVPKMLDFWSGNEECPGAFLLSELKGKPLTQKSSPAVAFQVGVLQATLHSIQPAAKTETASIKNEFSNWIKFIENQFYSFAEDVREILDKDLYDQSIEKFNDMKNQLPSPDGPSFVHMDFRPANIIVDGEQVSGMIDFESVRFGSTEVDFTKLYRDFLRFDSTLYNAFQDGYNSIRPLIDLEVVLPFYRFVDAFNSIGWSKRRGVEKNASFLQENLAILEKILR